jgi:hypothetical protein
LDAARLATLFADSSVIDDLKALDAHVLLALSDYSAERAQVVQQLNQAGVPIVAIQLVSPHDGYYFTPDNVPQAYASYNQFKTWTATHGLLWDGIGLDLEPEADFFFGIARNPWGLVPMLLSRVRDTTRPARGRAAYGALVDRIHTDGWTGKPWLRPVLGCG